MTNEIDVYGINQPMIMDERYENMIDKINASIKDIEIDSSNFYKTSSQMKSVTLDVTDLTPLATMKHILAVIDQSRMALESASVEIKRKKIKLQKKYQDFESAEGLEKESIEIDIVEIENFIRNSENSVKGGLRRLNFFVTQYNAIKKEVGNLTEEKYEKEETKYHIMTALKQALISARARGGSIDEGNHIYFFDLGINGAAIQQEMTAYFMMENSMIEAGNEPTHEMTMIWMNAVAEKYIENPAAFATLRKLVLLDDTSLLREITA